MRHLLPHAPYGEQNASALQKSIVNAMTLDHNQTATQFVRTYILEDSPIGIKELRESIQTYRNISETIRKMRLKLEALKELQAILATLEEALETKFREQWIAKRAEWLTARATNRDFRTKLRLRGRATRLQRLPNWFSSTKTSRRSKPRWSGLPRPSRSTTPRAAGNPCIRLPR